MKLSRLFVHQDVARHPLVADLVKQTGKTPAIVADPSQVYESVLKADDPISAGKKDLVFDPKQGSLSQGLPRNPGIHLLRVPDFAHWNLLQHGLRLLHPAGVFSPARFCNFSLTGRICLKSWISGFNSRLSKGSGQGNTPTV